MRRARLTSRRTPDRVATLDIEEPSSEVIVGRKEDLEGNPLVKGVVIELRQDDTIHRAVTNSLGEFWFSQLLPGEWRLQVHHEGLSELYRIEIDEPEMRLESGENRTVEVLVVPVVRRIKFVDGGAVGGE